MQITITDKKDNKILSIEVKNLVLNKEVETMVKVWFLVLLEKLQTEKESAIKKEHMDYFIHILKNIPDWTYPEEAEIFDKDFILIDKK